MSHSHHHHHHSSSDSDFGLFIGLLVLIAWLPLPLASNHAWAWAIMEIWIFLLTLLWIWKFRQHQVSFTPVFSKATPVLIVWILWLIYIAFQFIPLPYLLVKSLSPEAAYFHSLTTQTDHLPKTVTLSVDPHITAVSWLKSVSYVLLFGLTLLLVNGHQRLLWLAYTLVFSGVFQAVYGSLMTLSGLEYSFVHHKFTGIGVATGTFVNRNHLAGYLEMSLAVGIGLLIAFIDDAGDLTWRQRLRGWLNWVLSSKMRLRLYLAMMVIGLVLTRSRGGNSGFFTSLVVTGFIGLILFRHATRATTMLLASLIIIDVLIVGTWFGIKEVKQRLEQTSFATESRDEVDLYTIPYGQDYFWTGSGLGSFYTVFPRYRKEDIQGYYDHAHNDYWEFGAETGLIGLLLLGSSVALSLWNALRAQHRRRDSLCRGMAFSAIMGIIALGIHSTVDFNLQIPANAATFMVILALAWISYYLPHRRKTAS